MENKLMTLGEVAEFLRISLSYARHVWPEWTKFGVNPIRMGGRGQLLFEKTEITAMIEQWRMVTK